MENREDSVAAAGGLAPMGINVLSSTASWKGLRVEHRRIGAGAYQCNRPNYLELAYILSGRSTVRRQADGPLKQGLALPGTSWLVPAGTAEKLLEFDGETECLLIYLPARLLDDSALIDYDIDPSQMELVYEGGFVDPALSQIALALQDIVARPSGKIDCLKADGLKTALSAHLVGNYTTRQWRVPARPPALAAKRLQRTLDYVEQRLAEEISLVDLANAACLSPFHFSRVFREATGHSPHRYVVLRRIEAAKRMIEKNDASLVDIALDTGFSSQASFSRAFRKATGLSPGSYRQLSR